MFLVSWSQIFHPGFKGSTQISALNRVDSENGLIILGIRCNIGGIIHSAHRKSRRLSIGTESGDICALIAICSVGSKYVKCLKLKLHCLRQKCSPNNLLFVNVWFIAIFLDISEEECVKGRYRALYGENSNCATLCGHLSNSWALVFSLA